MSIMSRIWVTPLLCFLSLISFFLSFFLFLSLLHITTSTLVCHFSKVSQFSQISQYSLVMFTVKLIQSYIRSDRIDWVQLTDLTDWTVSQLSSSVQYVSSVKYGCQSVSTAKHASRQLVSHLGRQTVVLLVYLKYHLQIGDSVT